MFEASIPQRKNEKETDLLVCHIAATGIELILTLDLQNIAVGGHLN